MSEEQDISISESEEPAGKKGSPAKAIIIVVVVTILGILLVPGKKREKDAEQAPLPPEQRPSLLEQGKQAAPAGEQAGQSTPAQAEGGPGAAARRLIAELRSKQPPDLARAYQAAQRFESEGKQDDAYLLYFYAARAGHGPSAMRLARAADPKTFKEGGPFSAPDALQANKWYSVAVAAGVEGAPEALAALRSAVEQRAARGDDSARRIMLQWK